MKKSILTITTTLLILFLTFKVEFVKAQTDPCDVCWGCGDDQSCYVTNGKSYSNASECFCDAAGCAQSCVPVNSKSWMLIPVGLGLVVVGWLFNKKKVQN
jgi:hypothetical protein